jgi:DNA-binding winged helix-turn-helix (wHTH) protein
MDSLITAAARALAAGDPLGALNRIALRKDAPALALRGIAMAQIGDFRRAKELVRAAARAFGAREAVARARCIVAEAELSLASRELGWPPKQLEAARKTLEKHGDRLNAAHARYLEIRRLLLIGRLDDADALLIDIERAALTPLLQATHELIVAGIAIRRIRTRLARAALGRAMNAARVAGIPALVAEVETAARILDAPAARLLARGENRVVTLEEVEAMFASNALIFDDCRYAVRAAGRMIPLAGRAVLFTLARALAEAWPDDISRDELVRRAFRLEVADESLRARLRVEIGRLRKALNGIADIEATKRGFSLRPKARQVVVLARPMEEEHAAVLAFLADGVSWPTSALALALGTSQRSVQRALDDLAAGGKVQAYGAGRARRWMTPPLPGIATTLLLPAPLPGV